MRRIYKTANLVVADLGEAGDDFDDAALIFNALKDLVALTREHQQIEYEKL